MRINWKINNYEIITQLLIISKKVPKKGNEQIDTE